MRFRVSKLVVLDETPKISTYNYSLVNFMKLSKELIQHIIGSASLPIKEHLTTSNGLCIFMTRYDYKGACYG